MSVLSLSFLIRRACSKALHCSLLLTISLVTACVFLMLFISFESVHSLVLYQVSMLNYAVLKAENCLTSQHPMAAAVSYRQISNIFAFFWRFLSHLWSFQLIGWSCWDTEGLGTQGRRMITRWLVHISFALVLISNYVFRCFLRHIPLRSAKLVKIPRVGEQIKDETESASHKEVLYGRKLLTNEYRHSGCHAYF